MGKKLVNIFIKLTSNLEAKFFDKIGIDILNVVFKSLQAQFLLLFRGYASIACPWGFNG